MIDLLSWCVLFSHFRPCDWFSREQFLSTCTCAYKCIYIIYKKTKSKFPWGHHHHRTSWKGLFRWARVLFRCPEEERGRIFATRKLLTSCGHKSRRSSRAQNSASYFQWSTLRKLCPHTTTLYPCSPKSLGVGGRGRETHPRTSYTIRFLYWISRCPTFQNLRTD